MYQIEYADLHPFGPIGFTSLKWEPYFCGEFSTERRAWEKVSQIIEKDFDNNEAGSFVYRIVKKGE